jgi:hypothetical protein
MAARTVGRCLRIPVRYFDGLWEFEFGGPIPVEHGTQAELIVSRSSVSDKRFLERMESKAYHKILDEGAYLLVGLTVKPENQPPKELQDLLLPYEDLKKQLGARIVDPDYRYDPFFIQIQLAGPTGRQVQQFGTSLGGLWLVTEGINTSGLASTMVKLPTEVSDEPVRSLNHAYTKLSEIFETWRISHTGNIYQRILYRERNGRWYPLDVLRNRKLQQREHEIAKDLWKAFTEVMSGDRGPICSLPPENNARAFAPYRRVPDIGVPERFRALV